MSEPTPSKSLEPGQNFGPYLLLERIGRGAMGEVWKARGTGRDVALKIPRRPEFLRHLQREEILLKKIDHPKVATVYRAEMAGDSPYLAMELVNGNSLRTLCTGTISPSDATLLCDQILQGLEAIHAEGILHLDLKPENVLVDQEGAIKIVDLGLGKATSTLMAEVYLSASLISRELPLAGTLAYMSPEQRRGHELDAGTDLYAFGVLLHELLSGKLPDPTLRLSQMRDDLTPRWDVVVAKLTHPDRRKRPKTAREARQLVAFTLVEKEVNPVAEGGLAPRDMSIADRQSLDFISPYKPGMMVGDYQLESILGRGGFGEVWQAKRGSEEVAIKLALKEEARPALVREAEIMAKLDHPAVPKVLADNTKEDPPHLVLELIRGKSLRLYLHEEERLDPGEAQHIFRAMAEAVLACHRETVIHRDLKPEHFVLALPEDWESPTVRLIDFGLAGMIDPNAYQHSLATGEGVGGTFDYMAPEQKEGEAGTRADVYSLGVCLFEMISGELPRGPQRLKSLCPQVSEELDQMVLSMLALNPGQRPTLQEILHRQEKTRITYTRSKPSWWRDLIRRAYHRLLLLTFGNNPYRLVVMFYILIFFMVLWLAIEIYGHQVIFYVMEWLGYY